MFIQTEATPNPDTLKFLPGCAVMGSGTANFTKALEAEPSPLATRLFDIRGVAGVFLGSDFITVTREGVEWDALSPRVLAAIMDHFTQGQPVMSFDAENTDDGASDSDVVKQIKELIETRVRPAVAQDGGDIVFKSFEDGIVYLVMQGACSGCPSSSMTLKNGIENMLRHYVPAVQEVRAVE
ncbi:MAG: NifU family protein [Rhodospirillaceae bacterium]|nr:NifU family protein [Rhodospirillaceae bacterium]MCK5546875.1 NifU family protein [Rhodospirillaceae bacterium]